MRPSPLPLIWTEELKKRKLGKLGHILIVLEFVGTMQHGNAPAVLVRSGAQDT